MEKIGQDLREKILVVQKGYTRYASTADTLSRWGYATVTSQPSLGAIEKVAQESPDLILFDRLATDQISKQLCTHLKADRFLRHIPIIVWGTHEPVDRIQWLDCRADFCLDGDALPVELVARIRVLLRRSVEYDPVTSLPTEAYLHRQLDAWLAKNRLLAILYAHIDHFHAYRSAYGQEAARRVLLKLAKLIVEALPPGNLSVAHLGDEDFMAVLPLEGARTFAETLLARFDSAVPEFYASPSSNTPASPIAEPRMELKLAVVTNERRPLTSYIQVTSLLAQVMKQLYPQKDN